MATITPELGREIEQAGEQPVRIEAGIVLIFLTIGAIPGYGQAESRFFWPSTLSSPRRGS
jgi:hypothetical protein